MTAHTYSLRSRISSSSLSSKTPTQSPLPKGIRSPRRGTTTSSVLQLKNVIGTTTSTPSGLSCCAVSNSYAYCAGSVAVLAHIEADHSVSYRYFKARPTVVPINQTTSYYDSSSSPSTPTRRRTVLASKKGYDDYSATPTGREWSDEAHGQTWTARERIKTATCVSISPDGRLLVVGETGYNPRVLLFSALVGAPTEIPLSIITEHTFGVRSVAFSPDSRFLATLGDVNDGFLYIWQVNTKSGTVRLHSTNKCTTNICDMTWCGNNVITVGTRHIKVWQASSGARPPLRRTRSRLDGEVSSPGPRPLSGRNCLLGSFADATFTAIVALSESQAVVCADDGHLCLLDLTQGKIELSSIEKTETTIAAISCRQNPSRVVWAGGGGMLEERDINIVTTTNTVQQLDSSLKDVKKRRRISRQSLLRQSLGLSPPTRASIIALECMNGIVIYIDADGMIRVSRIEGHDVEPDICRLSSHTGLVRGVQKLPKDAGLGAFFTWSRSGEVRFWDDAGELVRCEIVDLNQDFESEDSATNELKVLRYVPSINSFVTGDQFGMIQIVDATRWSQTHSVRGHSAEINSIDLHDASSLIATCGRDRMVQVFSTRNREAELLQTLDDHISVINQVLFNHAGDRLISCSADRTIVVRERVERRLGRDTTFAFISARTITMKAAPLSMSIMPAEANTLVISTMDRYVVKADVTTGATISSFKVSDRDSDDTAILNSICLSTPIASDDPSLLAGYSSIDKSIRLYDFDKGVLLGRDSGHTEGISDVLLIEEEIPDGSFIEQTIVSTGYDGTIMMWSALASGQPLLTPLQELSQAQALVTDPVKSPVRMSPASLPPLRKILSKMDMADFARQSSPTREVSPMGLRRKTSRLALSTSIEEADEMTPTGTSRSRSRDSRIEPEKRSPSPPSSAMMRPKKQRSKSEMGKEVDSRSTNLPQSPSPPAGPQSTPATPRHTARANNGRLRRPPSVPNDLRAQAAAQGRRQSVSSANDFGSIGMATEQACRMLKTYRKKLQASRGELDLDDVEADLEAVLKTIRQKKARANDGIANNKAKDTRDMANDEVNQLSVLLEKTSV